jgi:hypothetical protein
MGRQYFIDGPFQKVSFRERVSNQILRPRSRVTIFDKELNR